MLRVELKRIKTGKTINNQKRKQTTLNSPQKSSNSISTGHILPNEDQQFVYLFAPGLSLWNSSPSVLQDSDIPFNKQFQIQLFSTSIVKQLAQYNDVWY